MITLILMLATLVIAIVMFIVGYKCGHDDGLRCHCVPGQPFWRKWFNVHNTKGS